MAYFRKVKGGWRAEVEKLGVRESATWPSKAEAVNWATKTEADIMATRRGQFPRKTLADAMRRYQTDVSRGKRGRRVEELRFDALEREFPALAGKLLAEVKTPDLVQWRDHRLKTVTPGTVRREANLLRNLFSVARDEWKWCGESPFVGFRVPQDNPDRNRRVSPLEVRAICRWLGYRTGRVETKQQEVAFAFLLALRTAMRAGELLSLSAETVDIERRVARVPHKMQYLTGRPREIPLTKHGVRLLRPMLARGRVFSVSSASLDSLFRKARDNLLIEDLHFHDSRGEALTRMVLTLKVDVLTLSRISGIKDVNLLLAVYYRESAEDIAARL